MILCLDSGNTRLKWGIWHESQWLARGVVTQGDVSALQQQLAGLPVAEQVVGCNVAGPARAAEVAAGLGQTVSWLVSTAAACGVKNGYAKPAQLGTDRWASLIAVHSLHAGAALVVNVGTATTADMLTAAGEFVGGIILPGPALMRASLAGNTAQLPLAAGGYMPFPDNTDAAIASGVLE